MREKPKGKTRVEDQNKRHPKVLWFYLLRKLGGHELHPVNGDPNQLGGDFLFDKSGALRLAHRSQGPTDRPTVEQIKHAME